MDNIKLSLRSPLFQFLAVGAVLFALNYLFNSESEADSTVILNKTELDYFAKLSTIEGKLDTAIFTKLVDQRINQELIYQYGMLMKLPESDENIHAKVIETAQEIILAQAPLGDPGDPILIEFLNNNQHKYSKQSVFDFEQYFFGKNELLAQQALFVLNEGNTIQDSDSLGIDNQFRQVSAAAIERTFGTSFKDSIINLENGWRGIVASKQGSHVVINVNQSVIEPSLENLRSEIVNDWKLENQKIFYSQFLAGLRKNSDVLVNSEDYQFLLKK